MHYILFYKTADDYMERRGAFRQQHLDLAKQGVQKGEIVMGGALSDPLIRLSSYLKETVLK